MRSHENTRTVRVRLRASGYERMSMNYLGYGEQATTLIDTRDACEVESRMESRKRNIEETT